MTDIFEAYLAGGAREWFAGHFADPAARRAAVLRAARPLAPELAAALRRQNAAFTPSPTRDAHLDALCNGAAAVVSGQQAGLFLGPLFTLYKAAGAVASARALAAETGQPVVPVFWLQVEDHDLPEIAVCHVPCAQGPPLALRLPASPDEHISVAHRVLPDAVAACLNQLRDALVNLPYAGPHLDRLDRHYRPGAGWSSAFAGLLAELFAPEGLVLIDPRDPAVARLAAPIHRHAIQSAGPIAAALEARGAALHTAGYAATVHVRPGAPLSFFHPDGPTGRRVRLVPAGNAFTEVGGSARHTAAELLAALDAEPLSFSTSVLLRPILQDSLLPTVAYVGGPAEVAYFAQLAPVYKAYDLAMPLLVPRPRLRLIEDKTARLLQRLQLAPDDAARSEDDLLARTRAATTPAFTPAALTQTLRAPFDRTLAEVRERIAGAGHGLEHAIEKTRATVEMAVSKLAAKYDHALLHRDQALVDEVRRLKDSLYPFDTPQERVVGFSYFAARYGERTVIERVLAAIDPFDPRLRDLPLPAPAPDTRQPRHEVHG